MAVPKHDLLTRDEAAALHMFTAEGPLYPSLNEALRGEKRHGIKQFFGIIKLMLSGLYKLPLVKMPELLRGVKLDLSAYYKVGDIKIWWPFSSTTTSMSVLEGSKFLGKTGARTLFKIRNAPAISIKDFSKIPQEDEWLLLPGTGLTVESVTKTGDFTEIVMEFKLLPPMLDYMHPQFPVAEDDDDE
jgi:hypothetical protein